jgi:two-component system, NarL family, invasion response regulator UvrY
MSTVYVVDDHALMRDGLRALLSGGGHNVVGEADSPSRALPEIVRLVPDILLLDLNMGERSGLELQERLKRHNIATRTVLLTVDVQAHHVSEAQRLGVEGFVLKGTSSQELLETLERVMRGQRCWAPQAQALLESPEAASRMAQLSPREVQIVQLVVRGMTSAAIGQQLFLSPKTVDTYRSRLMAKLEVGDVPGLVRLAIREGIIGLDDH